MQHYDAIIVGAGPAGSSAAYFLGSFGIATLLLDKEEFPRPKLCSGGISPRTLKTLDEMNFSSQIEGKYHKITGTRIIAPNGRVTEGNTPKTERYRPYGYVIPRVTLDKKLRDHATETGNVEFRQEEVTDLVIDADSFRGVKTKRNEEIYAKVVILANGASSRLAQKCGLRGYSREREMMTLESWRERIETDDKINIYYPKKLLPGYFWIFPEGKGRANVGLGLWGSPKHKKLNVHELFREILNSEIISNMLGGSIETHKPKGWPITFRDPREIPVGNGIIAIGDSGGFANPFTAEGIYYALESGKFAAIAIREAFERGNFSAQGLELFKDLCNGEFAEDMHISDKLKEIFGDAESVNGLLARASSDYELSKILQGLIVNVIPKREILQFINLDIRV